jgi:GT2 family glycosyltransferase
MTTSVIVPTVTPARTIRLLESLRSAGGSFETIVVDNGTGSAELATATESLDGGELVRLEENLGYSRAVNLAARHARGDVLVLLNDDSVVDPGYVERLIAPIDPGAGVVMATGVMRDAGAPELIETAGIEIDRTLLAFDYLNGAPLEVLDGEVADPIGPSGATGAFWRDAFLGVGGFDEALFAYYEDEDLVLRLRLEGGSCRLARDARGTHEHSATLESGSPRKGYLIGYGRGYLLRKWSVITPRRTPGILLRELILGTGQILLDRNLGAARGRFAGLRARPEPHPFPAEALRDPPSMGQVLARRWRRRARLRRRSSGVET